MAQMEQGEVGITKLSLPLGGVMLGDGSSDEQTGKGGCAPPPQAPSATCGVHISGGAESPSEPALEDPCAVLLLLLSSPSCY